MRRAVSDDSRSMASRTPVGAVPLVVSRRWGALSGRGSLRPVSNLPRLRSPHRGWVCRHLVNETQWGSLQGRNVSGIRQSEGNGYD